MNIDKTEVYYHLLYQAVDAEILSPFWFQDEEKQEDLKYLIKHFEEYKEESECEEAYESVKDFYEIVLTFQGKPSHSSAVLKKPSPALKAILGSEWLTPDGRISEQHLMQYVFSQSMPQNSLGKGGKITINSGSLCSLLGLGVYPLYVDVVLRKLREHLS